MLGSAQAGAVRGLIAVLVTFGLPGCGLLGGDDFGVAVYIANDSTMTVFVRANSNAASPAVSVGPGVFGFADYTAPGDTITVFTEGCDVITTIRAPDHSKAFALTIGRDGVVSTGVELPNRERPELPSVDTCAEAPSYSN